MTVNRISAACETDSGLCQFEMREDLTPHILSATPSRNLQGDNTITISGQRFSNNPDEISVHLDTAICNVMTSTLSEIVCHALSVPVGNRKRVLVYAEGRGQASGVTYVHSIAHLMSVTPQSGSIQGGTLITIGGNGFIDGNTEVTINGVPCGVKQTSLVEHVCNTSMSSAGVFPIRIHSGGVTYPETLEFEYSEEQTPNVGSIEPGKELLMTSVDPAW